MKKDFDIAKNLLGQCQDGGYTLFDFVADIEGEEHSTLFIIKDYCDLVFQRHNELTTGENNNPNNIYKRLNKNLSQIEKSIKSDIVQKIEIAFLPYKASMWDSMESVWIAASEDPNCEVFVVPLPFYDRNPDWSFKTYFYEGEIFPEYVPITPYSDYNLEEIRPDIIYIHNPYDGDNFITSVHPNYYSDKLKEYTEQLIYIPYFSNSGKMGQVGAISSSYFNVDSIIIQSENVRDFFDKRIPSEKLVALGTPKFDRVINICNNDIEVPQS